MIYCFANRGFDGELVHIEVDFRRAIPGMEIVGLPDSAIKEACERVKSALKSGDYEFPRERIILNLAPASLKKDGAAYDLAMAASVLTESKQIDSLEGNWLILGELQLNGAVRAVTGVLSAVIKSREKGVKNIIVPVENLEEAQSASEIECFGIEHISQLRDIALLIRKPLNKQKVKIIRDYPDFSDIKGQEILKRALTIAAAGCHHILMFGPPGCGKTFSARAFRGILPDLSHTDSVNLTRIWSQSGKLKSGLLSHPPYREPHHSSSQVGILGGTPDIMPGEISLSHKGVLLLDEAPEFSNRVLQGLREPLETGKISIVRGGKSYWFPADFQLILTANPCPCGNLGRKRTPCICSGREIDRYWRTLSGPLMDRIDIRIPVSPASADDLFGHPGEKSDIIAARVKTVRDIQKARFPEDKRPWNGTVNISRLNSYTSLDRKCYNLIRKSMDQFGLSSRACHSVMRISRTIADLEESDRIKEDHILESIGYRRYGEGDLYWRK